MTFKHQQVVVPVTWVVVADAGRGRILAIHDSDGSGLQEVDALINPQGTTHMSENVSDQPGVFIGGSGLPVAGDPETDFHHKMTESFSRQIIDYLEAGRNSHQFGKLILIAAPSLLGALRQKMSSPLKRMVEFELDKDLTKHALAEIRPQIEIGRASKT